MHPADPLTRLALALLLTLMASTASAQSRLYVGGAALADIRRFDSVEYDPRVLASAFGGSPMDGTSVGGGLRVGTFLHPFWSLELAADKGSRSTTEFRNPIETLPTRSSTLRLPELSSSTRFLTVSTVVGFHPAKTGRVRLGYLGGLTFVRGTYESEIPDFSYLPTLTFTDLSSVVAGLSSVTLPLPGITARTLRRTDNSAGGIVGFEAAIDVSQRFALVPGVRAIVFSDREQSVFLIRPEAAVRWSF